MATKLTYDEYVEYLCRQRKMTREQLFAYLGESERVIEPCDCEDFEDCRGWICRWPTPEEEMAKLGVGNP